VDYGDPWELNRYGYTAGNPVRWTDSSGFAIDYKLLLSKVGAFVIAIAAICISTVLCRNTVVGAATDGASYLLGLAIHNARTCQVDPKDGLSYFKGFTAQAFLMNLFAGAFFAFGTTGVTIQVGLVKEIAESPAAQLLAETFANVITSFGLGLVYIR
jgi:hypothetical protein